jgi:peptidoglycan/xylan/chitin deacetylase (PgdA/CDA1 family)
MWIHKITAGLALRGEAATLAAFNDAVKRCSGQKPISGFSEFPFCARPWQDRKEEIADAVWDALSMPPVDQFLAEHRPYMDWPDLKDWIRRGHGVGMHTATHPICGSLREEDIAREFVEPAQRFRQELGLERLAFAYPFGDRLPPALERSAMEQAGLECMLGTAGVCRRGTRPIALERTQTEFDLPHNLYFRPLASALRGRSPGR